MGKMPYVILEEMLVDMKNEDTLCEEFWIVILDASRRKRLVSRSLLPHGRVHLQRICNQLILILSKSGRVDLAREVLAFQIGVVPNPSKKNNQHYRQDRKPNKGKAKSPPPMRRPRGLGSGLV